MTDRDAATGVHIPFLYAMCNDIDAVRAFYSDILGMQEESFMNTDDFGWLAYQLEGFQLMFLSTPDCPAPHQEEWAWQPGGGSGTAPYMSFSVRIPEERYRETVDHLRRSGARCQSERPEWRQSSYWAFTVKDPTGYTVEVYSAPGEKPQNPEWSDSSQG